MASKDDSQMWSKLIRIAILASAAYGAFSWVNPLVPAPTAAHLAHTIAYAACNGYGVKIGRWHVDSGRILPNPRAVQRGELSARGLIGAKFSIFHATGRPFVVAEQKVLSIERARKCLASLAKRELHRDELKTSFELHGTGRVDGRLVQPEPSWMESMLPHSLQLPPGKEFIGPDSLGKLYLDVNDKSGSLERKQPMMNQEERRGWADIALGFNHGGRHLDIGSGSSSHYACGLYAQVNAVESKARYCNELQSQFSADQSHCGRINMNCVNVGALSEFGKPMPGVTDVPAYFHQYVNAIEGFNDSPYYDSILVDGPFRIAAAVKALKFLRRDSLLLIHDWSAKYENFTKYGDLIGQHEKLAVFSPKTKLAANADKDYFLYPSAE